MSNSKTAKGAIKYPDWMSAILYSSSKRIKTERGNLWQSYQDGECTHNDANKYVIGIFEKLNNIVADECKRNRVKSDSARAENSAAYNDEQVASLDEQIGAEDVETGEKDESVAHLESKYNIALDFYQDGKYDASVEVVNVLLKEAGDCWQNAQANRILYKALKLKTAVLSDCIPVMPKIILQNLEDAINSFDMLHEQCVGATGRSLRLVLLSLKYRHMPDISDKMNLLEKLLSDCDEEMKCRYKNSGQVDKQAFKDDGQADMQEINAEILLTKAWVLTDLIELQHGDSYRRFNNIVSLFNIIFELLNRVPDDNYYWSLCAYSMPFLSQLCTETYGIRCKEYSCSILESIMPLLNAPNRALLVNVAWMYIKLAKATQSPHLAAFSIDRAKDLLAEANNLLKENVGKGQMRKEVYHYHLANIYVATARVECVEATMSITTEQRISRLHSAISLCESAIKLNPYCSGAYARRARAIVMLMEYHYSQEAMESMLKSSIQKCMDALCFAVDPAHLYYALYFCYSKLVEISDGSEAERYQKEAVRFYQLSEECDIMYK